VYGYYLASVILGLSYLENTLRGWFAQQDPLITEKSSLAILLRRALMNGLLDENVFDRLNEILQKRNAIPPFYIREKNGFANIMSSDPGKNKYGIGEQEAHQIMEVMMWMMTSQKGYIPK